VFHMEKILTYLTDLENNNNRQWYLSHKEQRIEAEREFEELLQVLILELGKVDNSILFNNPKDLTFKLVRDTRFSEDKSPYNPTFRAHISSKGKLPIPVGYFIAIKPNNQSFLGGGLFADMFRDATNMIRDYIDNNEMKLSSIVSDDLFASNFTVMGTALKNIPQGYNENCSMKEYLRNKSWYVEYKLSDEKLLDDRKFIEMAVEKYSLMIPFNSFLNEALVNFEMPERK